MTIYDRGVEHLKAHQSRKKESILVEHGVEEHEGRIHYESSGLQYDNLNKDLMRAN